MRVFTLEPTSIAEASDLPSQLPANGYVWIACARREFEVNQAQVQATLQTLCGTNLVDLHLADLLNSQLASHYDYTSDYDILVFRRLAAGGTERDLAHPAEPLHQARSDTGPQVLKRIDTSPVGFAVFDRVLLTVHPTDCAVRDAYASRLLNASSAESRSAGARPPASPADLMLRIINHMVDSYLDLRRELTHDLDRWQTELLNPRTRFNNWASMLDARLSLHYLDEICEDQRSAIQDWIEAVKTWPEPESVEVRRDRELLMVRSRDVLEHIERVIHHVDRMERSAEAAVQMHFNAQGNRTNDTMQALTALTAIFLPLNLIAGIFGMNFKVMPWLEDPAGFWWSMAAMAAIAAGLVFTFWRRRYLGGSRGK
jgi:magnesium transporter